MFSLEGITAITLHCGFKAARARIAPIIAAPPHMSYFMSSMPLDCFKEIPPESNVMAFPIRPRTGAPGVTFSGMYVRIIMRGGSALPLRYPDSSAPIFNSAILFSSKTSAPRPAFARHGRGAIGQENARRELVRRLIAQIARQVLRFGDDAAARTAFVGRGARGIVPTG